ncbi:DUF192 domain-containing protein [Candidatus Micrarchaeota archaeon]|nr:DUF192 domain-containing protein [Candidatus Micrarchaeota archaeon]
MKLKGNKGFECECTAVKSIPGQMKGLMFGSRKNLLFEFKNSGKHSIHSFFVFFRFDAVYLDENMEVVEIYKKVKPFTFNVSNKKDANYLLELADSEKIPEAGEKLCLDGKSTKQENIRLG